MLTGGTYGAALSLDRAVGRLEPTNAIAHFTLMVSTMGGGFESL